MNETDYSDRYPCLSFLHAIYIKDEMSVMRKDPDGYLEQYNMPAEAALIIAASSNGPSDQQLDDFLGFVKAELEAAGRYDPPQVW